MEQKITTLPPAIQANSSQSPADVNPAYLAAAGLLFLTFLVGVVGNGLYLWVLRWKMRRTVTTLWFFHLVSCYLLFTLLIPFFSTYILLGFHWVFGMAMCKLLNTCVSMGMFSSVFLLTLISLDRYTLTHYPIWSRRHRSLALAGKLVAGVWIVSFALSTPYLAFRETSMVDKGRITCLNNYNVSRKWTGSETWNLRTQIHLTIFMIHLLLGFLLPFGTIVGCYSRVGLMMKEKGLMWAGKPFKIMVVSVASFFLGWLPYQVFQSATIYKELSESVKNGLLVIYTFTTCFNACFSPILFLFVGEKFWKVFRTSLLTLVTTAFVDKVGSNASAPVEDMDENLETQNRLQESLP